MFSLGQEIKELRQAVGLSQKELASGICNQAQISNIEKNNYNPSALLLNQIATKLGVNMNYFFEMQDSHKVNYITDSKKYIRQLIRKRDYVNLYPTVLSEKKHPYYQDKENLQFILWHEALCVHYIDKDSNKAFNILNEALQITHDKLYFTEQEIEILNSIAAIRREIGLYEEAEQMFREALAKMKEVPKLSSTAIEIRLLFGLSQLLTDIGKFEESLTYCEKGIKLCNESDTLYIFGEFLYQRGENLVRLGKFDEARQSIEQSKKVFELQNNTLLVQSVEENQERLLAYEANNSQQKG
ncbi:helix-turn-helix domain-containing protein [Robertmurraya massiliosenegalensis]|uniref:helix-turn-helix domain-containing protein n=1 Tax=Robertmurraya massiliosenegalensis TaxID=1287657 RepID=UPI001F441879|nr:helix-turn-helix domain-containing protein [Robertmurraya massiliosenegalensis]